MFDIGFWELSLIMVIALIVVGPERLPKMARTIGMWVGRGRQILSSVKADIDRELKAEELKKMMQEQTKVPELHEFVDDLKQDIDADTPSAVVPPKPVSKESQPAKPSADAGPTPPKGKD